MSDFTSHGSTLPFYRGDCTPWRGEVTRKVAEVPRESRSLIYVLFWCLVLSTAPFVPLAVSLLYVTANGKRKKPPQAPSWAAFFVCEKLLRGLFIYTLNYLTNWIRVHYKQMKCKIIVKYDFEIHVIILQILKLMTFLGMMFIIHLSSIVEEVWWLETWKKMKILF